MADQHDSSEHTDAIPTVRDRLRLARISEETIQAHFKAGSIRMDGQAVTDLDQPAPRPARLVISPS